MHEILTVLQPQPQLVVVFLLHVGDYLPSMLQDVGLLQTRHEIRFHGFPADLTKWHIALSQFQLPHLLVNRNICTSGNLSKRTETFHGNCTSFPTCKSKRTPIGKCHFRGCPSYSNHISWSCFSLSMNRTKYFLTLKRKCWSRFAVFLPRKKPYLLLVGNSSVSGPWGKTVPAVVVRTLPRDLVWNIPVIFLPRFLSRFPCRLP